MAGSGRSRGDAAASTPERARTQGAWFRILAAVALCVSSVGFCVAIVDRPVANWVHAHLGDARMAWFTGNYNGRPLQFGPFSLMAGPAEALGPLALVAFAALALAGAAGWRPGARGRVGVALGLSVFAAIAINGMVKTIFGRTWPESWLGDNPSWIGNGVYGFFPFHGGQGWGSFPSGHTTIITTPISILWLVWPELRPVWALMVAVVVTGLIGANYHFVSDVIGGLFLGAAIGLSVAQLMLSPDHRLASARGWGKRASERQAPAAREPTSTEG